MGGATLVLLSGNNLPLYLTVTDYKIFKNHRKSNAGLCFLVVIVGTSSLTERMLSSAEKND